MKLIGSNKNQEKLYSALWIYRNRSSMIGVGFDSSISGNTWFSSYDVFRYVTRIFSWHYASNLCIIPWNILEFSLMRLVKSIAGLFKKHMFKTINSNSVNCFFVKKFASHCDAAFPIYSSFCSLCLNLFPKIFICYILYTLSWPRKIAIN